VLRTTTPAAPWQRSVFNGWAQVIVQSTGQPGAATLSATSGELAETMLRFEMR
jgi:beta-galactosidase